MLILNGSPGFGVPLTQQEVTDFLANSKWNIHIATVDEKGDPNIHPAWFYFEPSYNKIYVGTSKLSKKIINLRKNGRLYFCIDDPNPPYKGVRGKGRVKINENIDQNIPIAEKMMVKYLGSFENEIAKTIMNMVRKGDEIIIEITPGYFSTWDYSKRTSE